MSPLPTLPPELISEILGFLTHNKQALARCSLVSHQWCQLSSPYLFRSLQLREPPFGYPDEPFEALHMFIRDNPRIQGLVRELKLRPVDGLYEVPISLGRIRSLLALLPSLDTIIVGSVQLREIAGDSLVDPQDGMPPLRLRHVSLSTAFCLGVHPTFLSRFLSLFDQIDGLYFQGSVVPRALHGSYRFSMPTLHDLQLALNNARPAVKSVTLGRFDSAQKLLPLLPAFVRIDTLEALRVSHFMGHLVEMVDTLLRHAPNLRELSLFFYRFASANLSYAMAQSEQYRLPGLAACPHLESVTLGVDIHLDYDLSDINLVYWRRCLDALSSAQPAVRRVALAVQTWAVTGTSYFEPLAELDWELLDAHLARFPHLAAVRLDISSRTVGKWILAEAEMCDRLAGMFSPRNRGVLQVAFGDAPYTDS